MLYVNTTSFHMRNLSNVGMWYPRGSWNKFPLDIWRGDCICKTPAYIWLIIGTQYWKLSLLLAITKWGLWKGSFCIIWIPIMLIICPIWQENGSLTVSIFPFTSHMKYMAFFLKSSQRSARFPGNETAIQADPGREQSCANSHIPCIERSPLDHMHGGCVCQPLGLGSPGSCINCLKREVIYGITNLTLA